MPGVIGGAKGAMCPVAEEIVFPIQQFHFKHELFTDMMKEGGSW